MKRFIALALVSIAAMLGLVSVAPAQATAPATPAIVAAKGPASGPQDYALKPNGDIVGTNPAAKAALLAAEDGCQPEENGKCYWFNDLGTFWNRNICFQNNLGVYWNYVQAQQGFQSGSATVTFYNHGASTGTPTSCADSAGWNLDQILTYQAYTTNDGNCAHWTRNPDQFGYYQPGTTLWMNASPSRPSNCGDTLQHRNNNISRALGNILGLSNFNSSTNLTAAVMNTYFSNSYNYPGTDDRNALYYLYYFHP